MKRKNVNFDIKYKKFIENFSGNDYLNPDLVRLEITPRDFIDLRGKFNKLNHQSFNSKIDLVSHSIKVNQNLDLDAKIKHKKKRDGD